jgi:zinc and cadmium transporter
MSTLTWILLSGFAMLAVSFSGSLLLFLNIDLFQRATRSLLALAAGCLLGGALFHLLPAAYDELGNNSTIPIMICIGLLSFFLLDQLLNLHNHYRQSVEHKPIGTVVLIADALHHFIDGVAVGSIFVIDHRLGLTAWFIALAHEVPQELGDFGILIHSGWSRISALFFNAAASSTFIIGSLCAYVASGSINLSLVIPFAAGIFLYIALSDLIPELKEARSVWQNFLELSVVITGMVILYLISIIE